jgi:general secretion pathway protein G
MIVDSHRSDAHDRGFTLIELLVVIVILGVLATVVVFAVGGVVDRGEVSALEGDARTLQTAEESHYAIHGEYATETELVSAGLLRDESDLHDITVDPDGTDYTIAPTGAGGDGGDGGDGGGGAPESETTTTIALPGPGEPGGPPLSAAATSFAEQPGWSYGPDTSSKTLVIIGNGSGAAGQNLWNQITTAGLALAADTRVVWMDQVSTRQQVDAILASNPTYVIVPIQVNLEGGGYAGQYISTNHHLSSPGEYWWGQQQGGVTGAIDYYLSRP